MKFSKLGIALITFLVVLSAAFVVVSPVHAASINDNGTLPAGETVDDDLIIGGENVQVDGTVNGMLIAAGQTVTINGTINGDVAAFGQNVVISDQAVITGNLFTGAQFVTVNGQIGGSIFTGGYQENLGNTATVGRNVYFGGYSLIGAKGSDITIDLRAGAGEVNLQGNVGQNAVIDASDVALSGTIGRNAEVWLDGERTSSNNSTPLRVDANAIIGGKLIYTSPQQYDIAGKPAGGIVFNEAQPQQSSPSWGMDRFAEKTGIGARVWRAVSSFITLMLVGLLAVGVFPKCFTSTVDVAEKRTLASAGVGLLVLALAIPAFVLAAFVIVLVGLLLSLVSLGGLTFPIFGLGFSALGLAGAALIVVIAVVSKLIAAYMIGDLIFKAFKANLSGFGAKALPLLVGVAIFVVMATLPLVGWLFSLLGIIIGTGTLWFWLFPGKSAAAQPPELTPANPAE